jgi:hypothetical protein
MAHSKDRACIARFINRSPLVVDSITLAVGQHALMVATACAATLNLKIKQ